MSEDDPGCVVEGAELVSAIFSNISAEVRRLGGTPAHYQRLTKPEGARILQRIAECIVPEGERNLGRYGAFPIEEFEFSVRSTNALKAAGIDTINDLVALDEKAVAAIPNLGKLSLQDIIERIGIWGLSLGMRLPE
jgi:DNA-directed RNA polymerase alpha subunit